MIFIIFISAVFSVLVYLQGCIAKKNASQMSSSIDVAGSIWAKLSTFKGKIVSNAFCYFTPVSSFAYSLTVCSNNNDNYPSGSLLGSFFKSELQA